AAELPLDRPAQPRGAGPRRERAPGLRLAPGKPPEPVSLDRHRLQRMGAPAARPPVVVAARRDQARVRPRAVADRSRSLGVVPAAGHRMAAVELAGGLARAG